jgi:Immunoglobulin domain/Immunoglobulin I-set domain
MANCRNSFAQTLNLPSRPANAPTGSQFSNIILLMSQTDRENWILNQVAIGNIPNWMRTLVPVTVNQTINGTPHTLTYYVAPDYLAIGSDQDYFLEPTTPILAQRIANLLNCTLPTRLMVNQIWTNATVKLTPYPIAPTNNNNATVPVFILQDTAVMAQRNAVTNAHPLGALVSGDKKDEIISNLIYNNLTSGVPKPVVIYGWMYTDGTPIQGEVNVHAESYMDYSHGIRMVQMSVTLDGAANTVTNILTDPTLWPLLSDEGGPIPKPYYTIDNTLAPTFITQPFSQTVKLGANVAFSPSIVGDVPLTYKWQFNGVNLANATNATLSLTNVQGTNSGLYTVVITNIYGSATNIPAVLQVNTNAFPLLFSDSLATDTSANWNFFTGSDDNVPDYTTNWAFNYGVIPYTFNGVTYVIPPAPNSIGGSTTGVRFTVNDSNGVDAAVNIYPKGQSFSGNFALKFDMWLNHPGGSLGTGGSGTTEYAICGINHTGTEINWDATNSPPSTDGIWFGVDGDGGANSDYLAFVGNLSGMQTQLTSTSGLVSSNHTNPTYETLFPTSRFETVGVPGKNWVAGEIDQTNGMITWKMNGTIIAQRSNTSSFTSGDIMLGYMDIFPSIASPLADAYLLYNNVRVEDWSSAPLQPPSFSSPPNQTVNAGTNVTFSVASGGATPLTYQWSFNGTNISGATSSSYTLTNVFPTSAGSYSVVVSNVVGSVPSTPAQLTVDTLPAKFGQVTPLPDGKIQISFSGSPGTKYTIEGSTNLVNWFPIVTLSDTTNPVTIIDTNALRNVNRFYRSQVSP